MIERSKVTTKTLPKACLMGSWKEDKTPAVPVVKWFPFLKKGGEFAHFKEGVGIYYTHLMLTRYPSCSFLLGPSCMFNS